MSNKQSGKVNVRLNALIAALPAALLIIGTILTMCPVTSIGYSHRGVGAWEATRMGFINDEGLPKPEVLIELTLILEGIAIVSYFAGFRLNRNFRFAIIIAFSAIGAILLRSYIQWFKQDMELMVVSPTLWGAFGALCASAVAGFAAIYK